MIDDLTSDDGTGALDGDEALPSPDALPAELRAALVPDAVRARTRARLLARARDGDGVVDASAPVAAADASAPVAPVLSERAPDAPPTTSSSTPQLQIVRRGVPTPLFAAAAVALAASLVLVVSLNGERSAARTALAEVTAASSARIDSLRAVLDEREALVASLTGRDVVVFGLASTEAADPRALMFWDQARDRWTFVAHNMPTLAAGRTYQLWLVTDDAKISAGTFRASPNGDAVVEATYALDRSALRAVAVTEEVDGGAPQPTGPMVVVGTAATL